MKVKAKRLGWYKSRRIQPGQIFELASEVHFSASWMEKVEAAKSEAVKEKPSKAAKTIADSEVI
jgi:hypothetical protein